MTTPYVCYSSVTYSWVNLSLKERKGIGHKILQDANFLYTISCLFKVLNTDFTEDTEHEFLKWITVY